MKFMELPSERVEGMECDRAGCDKRLGELCWWSEEAEDVFFCSQDCGIREYGATRAHHPAGKRRLPAGDPFRTVPLDDGETLGIVKDGAGQLLYRTAPS